MLIVGNVPPCRGALLVVGVSLGCGGWGFVFWLRRARDCEGASRVPSPSNTFTCPPVSGPHGYAGRNNVPRFPLVAYWDMVGVGRACATACRKFVPRFRVLSDAGVAEAFRAGGSLLLAGAGVLVTRGVLVLAVDRVSSRRAALARW